MPDPTHLQFLQGAIARMAQNSANLKTWTVTITAALFVLSAKDANGLYVTIAVLPISIFWMLDAYYLHQERCFRALYNRTIDPALPAPPPFSMDTTPVMNTVQSPWVTAFSRSVGPFYGAIMISACVALAISIR